MTPDAPNTITRQACVPHKNSVCAVVVTYFPDKHLGSLLKSVLPQVETLVVVDCVLAKADQDPAPRFDYKDAFELD